MTGFGEALREQRNFKGLTQAELGKKVGVSAQVISNMERGVTTSLDPDLLKSVASALDTTPEKLLGLEPTTGRDASHVFIDRGDFSIKEKIRSEMKIQGMSEEKFMQLTGFSKQKKDLYLYSTPVPSIEDLIKIARCLHVSTDWLLDLSERKRISADDELLLQTISKPERKLITTFRQLNEDYRDIIIGKAKEALVEQNKALVAEQASGLPQAK